MAKDLFINTDQPDRSVAIALGNGSAGEAQGQGSFPKLAYGDKFSFNLYYIKNDATYDARSGAAGTDPEIRIFDTSRVPTGGTFTITDGTDTTSALDYDASATDVQTALNALNTNTGPDGITVTVIKYGTGQYQITGDSAGAISALTVDASAITPQSSAQSYEITAGDSSTAEVQVISILSDALVTSSQNSITNGWSVTLDCATSRVLRAVSEGGGSATLDFRIEDVNSGDATIRETIATGTVTMLQASKQPTAIS